MYTHLKNIAYAAGISTLALSTGAFAAEEIRISKIDVESSIATNADNNALGYYPDLAEDLREEVSQRVSMSSDASDPQIRIDIRKIALNGATFLPETKEFNELEGVVDITSPTGESSGLSFEVKVSAYSGDAVAPEGYINVSPSETEFYIAMVTSFADIVAENLANVNTSGNKVDP